MKSFVKPSRLRKTAMTIMVKHMTPDQLKDMRVAFKRADTDHSGTIEKEEFVQFYREIHPDATEEECGQVFDNLDWDDSGSIDYEEFLVAAIDLADVDNYEDKYQEAFNQLKMSSSNVLTKSSLMKSYTKYGKQVKQDQLHDFFNTHEEMTYDEFKQMVSDDSPTKLPFQSQTISE